MKRHRLKPTLQPARMMAYHSDMDIPAIIDLATQGGPMVALCFWLVWILQNSIRSLRKDVSDLHTDHVELQTKFQIMEDKFDRLSDNLRHIGD